MEILSRVDAIIEYARSHIGYKEYKGNQGFPDTPFDNIMRQNGFQNGWAWCMIFAKSAYTVPMYSGKSKVLDEIISVLCPGAVKSYHNASKSDFFEVSKTPQVGDIIIWQKYKDGVPHWTGHAGICDSVTGNKISAIEGNTNSEGGREGIEVALMSGMIRHDLSNLPVYNGLNFLGCIRLKS